MLQGCSWGSSPQHTHCDICINYWQVNSPRALRRVCGLGNGLWSVAMGIGLGLRLRLALGLGSEHSRAGDALCSEVAAACCPSLCPGRVHAMPVSLVGSGFRSAFCVLHSGPWSLVRCLFLWIMACQDLYSGGLRLPGSWIRFPCHPSAAHQYGNQAMLTFGQPQTQGKLFSESCKLSSRIRLELLNTKHTPTHSPFSAHGRHVETRGKHFKVGSEPEAEKFPLTNG